MIPVAGERFIWGLPSTDLRAGWALGLRCMLPRWGWDLGEWAARNGLCSIFKQTLLVKSIWVLSSNWPNKFFHHKISWSSCKHAFRNHLCSVFCQALSLWEYKGQYRGLTSMHEEKRAEATLSDSLHWPGGLFKGCEWLVSIWLNLAQFLTCEPWLFKWRVGNIFICYQRWRWSLMD